MSDGLMPGSVKLALEALERRLAALEKLTPMVSNERLLLLLTDERHKIDALSVRLEVMEFFIKKEFPNYFAGEADTVADPALHPIPITYGAPQESDPAQWKEAADERSRP